MFKIGDNITYLGANYTILNIDTYYSIMGNIPVYKAKDIDGREMLLVKSNTDIYAKLNKKQKKVNTKSHPLTKIFN